MEILFTVGLSIAEGQSPKLKAARRRSWLYRRMARLRSDRVFVASPTSKRKER
jgi:hypothetical protein